MPGLTSKIILLFPRDNQTVLNGIRVMATEDDEHQGLQIAIRESLQQRTSPTAVQFADPSTDFRANPTRRMNIDDRIREIALQPISELPLVRDPSGDTWVFIDPPPKQPEQDDVDYTRYLKRYEDPMLVKKDMLLKYNVPGSDGFNFEALFGPSAQFHIIRRRNLTAKLRQTPGIKYVIDLTPPSEGEDAVFLMTELCCSQGVRLWYQAGDIWRVSKGLVGGTEEYTSAQSKSPDYRIGSTSPKSQSGPSEYSLIRHRSAIERVIAALMGIDPKLDSAVKVWTTFAVAKHFAIRNSPLTDYIICWIRAYPNSFFLEVCPEVSLRIADGLENQDLARDSFAILVGEEALDSLVRARMPRSNNPYSKYGRKKEDLPERMFSRIEYASKSFQERMRAEVEALAGEKMRWIEDLPGVKKLLSNHDPKLSNLASILILQLKIYVRGSILKLLFLNYGFVPPPEFFTVPQQTGEVLIRCLNRAEVWADLSFNERIMTRTFWQALLFSTLFKGSTNLDIEHGWDIHLEKAQLQQTLSGPDLGAYDEVLTEGLNQIIWEGNELLGRQQQLPMFDLPNRTRLKAQARTEYVSNGSTEPYQPSNDLYRAQITSKVDQTLESTMEIRPSLPVNIPEQTPRANQPALRSDLDLLRDTNTTFRDDSAVSPDGMTREDWVNFETVDGRKHLNSLNTDTEAITDSTKAGDQLEWPIRWEPPELSEVEAKVKVETQNHAQEAKHDGASYPRGGGLRWLQPKPETTPKEPNRVVLARTAFFDLDDFFSQARKYIKTIARRKLECADHGLRNEPHEIGITNTLICLDENEWKYLPLWAGGFDDGTGGVFSEQLPTADLGFSTSGPAIHTGFTPANSISAPSEFEMVDSEIGADTMNTSMVNNRSAAGALNLKYVYAADSIDSSSSEEFELVPPIEDALEEDARRRTEAQERIEAAEEEAAKRFEIPRGRLVDENYADLFSDYQDDNDTDRANDSDSFMEDDATNDDIELV